jgi:membrane-associated phospholipid phosphatase
MKTKSCLFALLIPFVIFSQVNTPSEIRRKTLIKDIGDYALHVPALTSLLMIIVKKDKEGFGQFTKSYGTTLAVTYALKYAINKPRPKNATDGHAFPSGHTSAAFSGATFLQRRYGWEYGIPAYAVASFVGYSRIKGDRHDIWDVLGGVIVGVGSSYLFTKPYQQEHMELSFNSNNGNYLVGFNYNF